jgi:methionyl-tRNA formyltransferase
MSLQRVVFVGSKALGASVLNTLYSIFPQSLAGVVTFDDTSDTRCALDQFREFERRTGKPLRVLQKGSELQSAIVEYQPDLCIVVGWYWVLKPELLKIVSHGWLGIHASLLPKNRGGAPLVWAILNGEIKTGLSLFYFDEGMDTGDIVAQKEVSIEFEDTIADVLAKTENQSIEIIRENYPLLLTGGAPRLPQDHSQATYVALRHPSDGRIDWSQPAPVLYNFIRAQTHPYPGAFCFLNEKTIRIWSAKPFAYPYYGSPGQVVLIEKDHVVVTCGAGTGLCLYQVNVEGSEEQNASQILKFGQHLM